MKSCTFCTNIVRFFFHAIFVFLFFRLFLMHRIRMKLASLAKHSLKSGERHYRDAIMYHSCWSFQPGKQKNNSISFKHFQKNIQSYLLFPCSKVTQRPDEKKSERYETTFNALCHFSYQKVWGQLLESHMKYLTLSKCVLLFSRLFVHLSKTLCLLTIVSAWIPTFKLQIVTNRKAF